MRTDLTDSLRSCPFAAGQGRFSGVQETKAMSMQRDSTGDITCMMTVENNDNYTELRFSPHAVSFMTNDIILQRRRDRQPIETRDDRH
jgi:hypothetical protein